MRRFRPQSRKYKFEAKKGTAMAAKGLNGKVPAAESKVQVDHLKCEWIGSEGRDGDGGERVCNNRDHRPAVEVHEEGWPCRIRVAGDVDDSAEWGKLLGKGAYWMLVHIFGREDEAGIGPAGPRCSAGPWTTNEESLESIGLPDKKLWSSSFVDRVKCESIGSEGRDGDGSERVCDNGDHRPAVEVHEEGIY